MSADCIFCKIARGEIPSDIILEDDQILAFRDIAPQAPTHVLVIPRRHIESLDRVSDDDGELMARMLGAVRDLARELGIAESGYRVVTNIADHGGQAVPHLHFHILGGRAMGWPPG